MQISVWFILVAAILFFAFGAGVTAAIDWEMMAHWRRAAAGYEATLTALHDACRKTLSDAWYKRVLRRFREDVERMVKHDAR